MNLRQFMREWLERVDLAPARAVAPEELNGIRDAVTNDWEGSTAALEAPCAPYTWEERVELAGANAESQRVAIQFPHAVEIVGMYASVVPITNTAGLRVPTLDDVDVSLDLNNTKFQTNAQGVSVPGGPLGGNFVTLTSLTVLVPRTLRWRILGVNPNVGIQFRWKLGTGVYQDSLIALAFLWRDAIESISYNVPDPGMYKRTR